MVIDFGIFENSTGFNRDRLVKQFGGESVRTRVEKCVDDNNQSDEIVDKIVQRVMNCFEDDKLKLYRE